MADEPHPLRRQARGLGSSRPDVERYDGPDVGSVSDDCLVDACLDVAMASVAAGDEHMQTLETVSAFMRRALRSRRVSPAAVRQACDRLNHPVAAVLDGLSVTDALRDPPALEDFSATSEAFVAEALATPAGAGSTPIDRSVLNDTARHALDEDLWAFCDRHRRLLDGVTAAIVGRCLWRDRNGLDGGFAAELGEAGTPVAAAARDAGTLALHVDGETGRLSVYAG